MPNACLIGRLLCGSFFALTSPSLSAQEAFDDDVVIMRVAITKARVAGEMPTLPGEVPGEVPGDGDSEEPAGPDPDRTYDWVVSGWSTPVSSCSDAVLVSREVFCRDNLGTQVEDSFCLSAKPEVEQTVADYRACSYDWILGSWSDWSSDCAPDAVRTRTVSCQRSGGTTSPLVVEDYRCSSPKPATSEQEEIRTGCPPEPAAQFLNGGFEQDLADWVSSGTVTIVSSPVASGSKSLLVKKGASVSQEIPTQAGRSYRVSFTQYAYGSHNIGVRLNGQVTNYLGYNNPGNQTWVPVYFDFLGDGSPVTITFTGNQGFAFVNVYLDDVTISPL